jgi:hypothetical protein
MEAWVYRNNESSAAYCHKVPQNSLQELLAIDVIEESIIRTIRFIQSVNPKAVLILRSHLRHIKDGFVENQWSKSN